MEKKKELSDEELELVNGGVGERYFEEKSDGPCGAPHRIDISERGRLCRDRGRCKILGCQYKHIRKIRNPR